MDSNVPADNAPVTPEAELPPVEAPVTAGSWLKANGLQLVTVAAVLGLVCYFLNPLDVLLATVGLSLIIFIHELGHFASAKLCNVHVKTFSIGFGPALPFCSFRYGETTYKLALIPLGGFVAMVGEGEGEDGEAEPTDEPVEDTNPRSFKNKPVWQRMIIISAGVIMNIILGAICFVITYMHGVEEKPAVAAFVEPGSAAWRGGIRTGAEIKKLNDRENPWFDDIRPVVSSTGKGEQVRLETEYKGQREALVVEPIRAEGVLYPQLGIAPPEKLTLRVLKRDDTPPYDPGSVAAEAKASGSDTGFLPGDRIVAMSDPANPAKVTPIDPRFDGLPGEYFDYTRRLSMLAGKPITFHIVRKDDASATPVPITVAPAFHQNVGLRMRMGAVVAVRKGSAAEKAGVQSRNTDGDKVLVPGDRIAVVELPKADGTSMRFTADKDRSSSDQPLDPIRLPAELDWWFDSGPTNRKIKLIVLREVDHTEQRVPLELEYDPSFRHESSSFLNPGTPVPLNGIGLAYHVQTQVDGVAPGSVAAAAGLQPNDQIVKVRYKVVDHKGKEILGSWEDIRPHQWAYADFKLQQQAPHAIEVKIDRGGVQTDHLLTATPDENWPVVDRGLDFMPETRTQKAEGLLDALDMGVNRTVRSVKMIYLGLYSIVFGRISVKMMSGPITLARASYIIAGEDIWHLLLWMGLISINLAVVNFLPIPVLDGGHMVFLTYEWLRGKPAPGSVQVVLTYAGLACVLSLMLFVIGLDIWRLFLA